VLRGEWPRSIIAVIMLFRRAGWRRSWVLIICAGSRHLESRLALGSIYTLLPGERNGGGITIVDAIEAITTN
jgi:hypothetical protein